MSHRPRCWHGLLTCVALAAVHGAAMPAIAQTVLSTNLTATTTDVETVTGTDWLTASFGTGTSAMLLDSATLKLASTVTGSATLRLYTDGGLQPGTLVGTLTSPTSYSTTLADTTFTSGSLMLAANTTYWLVLSATSGSFDWAWTTDNTGTGVGFQHVWGESEDAGETWFTLDVYPTQFSVTASLLAADFNSSGGVTAADLSLLRSNYGLAGTATTAQGDADGDLDVDGADFLIWQRQLGLGGSSAIVAQSAVPEPAGTMAAATALAPLLIAGRRLWRRRAV
jgi:hypothetical protein